MSRVIVFDSGVLGMVTNPNKKTPEARAAAGWAVSLMAAGHRVVVPAIADYEVRRELVRSGSTRGELALDAWNHAEPGRFLDLTNRDLRRACRLWAQARNAGTPTAEPKELDGDVLISAQALHLGLPRSDFMVATTNVGHLSLFVPADLWTNISP
jgi:predicted nucleic acid-binding protein